MIETLFEVQNNQVQSQGLGKSKFVLAGDFPLRKVKLKETNKGDAGSNREAGQSADP